MKIFNKIERRYPWGTLGVLIGALGLGFAIYVTYWRDTRPEIRTEILSNATVLDIKEQVSDLKVIYSGEDIRKAQQSLRIIIARVSNIGSTDVLPSYYDANAPFGLRVTTGSIIKSEIIDASEEYITDNLKITKKDDSTIILSPIIFGATQYVTLKILILYPEREIPTMVIIGKMANIKSIAVTETLPVKDKSVWSDFIDAPLKMQLSRAILYNTILLIVLVSLVVIPMELCFRIDIIRRKKILHTYMNISEIKLNESKRVLFNWYVEYGASILKEVEDMVSGALDISRLVPVAEKNPFDRTWTELAITRTRGGAALPPYEISTDSLVFALIRRMKESGAIVASGDGYQVTDEFIDTYKHFTKYLEKIKRSET